MVNKFIIVLGSYITRNNNFVRIEKNFVIGFCSLWELRRVKFSFFLICSSLNLKCFSLSFLIKNNSTYKKIAKHKKCILTKVRLEHF